MPQPLPTWPAACSPLASHHLAGGPRAAHVLAAFPTALYLQVGRHEDVLPVLAHDALALPTGLRLPRRSCQLDWGVAPGDVVRVGDGRVLLPAATVVSVRTARPPRVVPRTASAAAISAAAASLEAAAGSTALTDLAADLVRAGLAGRAARSPVAALVGAGRGLTPSGDDALCGVLLTLRACGANAAHARVSEAVRGMTGATTSLAASLLLAAIEGYAVPDVVRLLTVLTTRATGTSHWQDQPRPTETGRVPRSGQPHAPSSRVADSVERVLSIGHSSGHDLVAGILGTLVALSSSGDAHPTPLPHPPLTEGARRA